MDVLGRVWGSGVTTLGGDGLWAWGLVNPWTDGAASAGIIM